MNKLATALRWLAKAQTPTAAIAHTITSRVVIIGINVFTGILVARSLQPAGRGSAAAMALWPMVLSGVTSFGVPTALRYYIRQHTIDDAELLSTAICLGFISGFVAVGLGAVLLPDAMHAYPPAVLTFSLVMILFVPHILVSNVLVAYLEASGRFTTSNRMQYVGPAATLASLLALLLVHKLSIYTVPLAYFVPSVFVTAWTAARLRHMIKWPTRYKTAVSLLLGYGIRAYGLNILSVLSAQIDQAIIVGFMTAASFGLYGIALNIAAMLGILAMSINTVLFPKAASMPAEEAIMLVCRSGRVVFAITSLAYLVSLPIMPFLIHAMYGPQYEADVALTRVLMIEVVLGSTYSTFAQAFMATGRPGIISILQGVAILITFPLMMILIPRFGLSGAAFALTLSSAARLAMLLFFFPLFLQQRMPSLLPTIRDLIDIRIKLARASHA